jgi:membrane-associated phospholipid phosphatase
MKYPCRLCLTLAILAHAGLPQLGRAQLEPTAGSWKTWVLTSGSQLRLPPPPDEAATRDEIEQLRQLQLQRSAALLDRLSFWNAGPPAFRWTSTALPPGVANAVLNTRVMSLLTIAVYDATIAAWDSKYTYNRPRPSVFDPTLKIAIANPNTPSYPSEHAVVAGAAATVLSYLFPARADALASMAEEAAQVWVQAGVSYPSDAKAGLDLGRAVGARVVERAKTDGSDMTGTVDIPPGPCRWTGINPATPFFGSVRTWVLVSGSQLRPGPPPDCRTPQGQAEFVEVRDYPRTFDSNSTAFYWQSSRSNWNNVIDQKIFEYGLDANPPRAARIYAIASIAAFDATVACWDAKYTYWAIRPFMLGATTIFSTPNHPSYPAAHGCQSGAYSSALAYLFPRDSDTLTALGTEAGQSRLWAGIHFRSDIAAGLALGRAVTQLVIDRVRNDGAEQ